MRDLIVAGGGPTGLAVAIAAAQRGLSVAVIEPQPGPIDKACGEGLMPAGLRSLARLGVHPEGLPFRGIRYVAGPTRAEAELPGGPGLGVRRLTLHRAMWARAEALGVTLLADKLVDQSEADGRVDLRLSRGARESARYLVGADGLRSPLRARLGLNLPPKHPPRVGLRRHFEVADAGDLVEVHWADEAEAYLTPVAPGVVGLAILAGQAPPPGEAEGGRFDRLLARFPALRDRLGAPASALRGAGPFEVRLRGPRLGRCLLVGDAAGYLDPLTGEGLRFGLEGAERLVELIAADRPQDWPRAWARVTGPATWATEGLLRLTRAPALRRRLVPALARAPWLMRLALGVLGG
jgi:2-polyprenyl-6-methoxyphenol hydroxylase-like FAD-dependent oxidoreductase